MHAAWAFVVCAKWENDAEPRILGFRFGSVCLDQQHPDWLGATEVDSYQAEVMALTYATLWMCQEPLVQAGVPCEFVADSTSALHGADGKFQIHHPYLSQVLRPLQKMAEGLTEVEHRWQKAHVGDPHNELADHLAKHAARLSQPIIVPSPLVLPDDLLSLSWAWMVTHQAKTSRWPEVTEHAIDIPVPAPLSSCDIPAALAKEDQQQLQLSLQLTTCNINSFKDSDEKVALSWTGRAELVRAQAIEIGSHVIAFQETRRSYEGQWTSSHFVGFESPAKQGRGGVSIWIRHDIPFAHVFTSGGWKPVFFRAEDFVTEVAEPEILVLKYKSSLWSAIFISAHAPNDTAPEETKTAFWRRLQSKLEVWVSQPVFLCVDANARLGTRASTSVGSFYPEEENDNGTRFHAVLQSNQLCVPSTFEACIYDMKEEQGTWLAKNGWKRIDYIAIPHQFLDGHIQTWTHVIEKDVLKEDHRAASVSLRACLTTHSAKHTHCHPSLLVDRVAMQTADGKKTCAQLLEYFCQQQPPWTASADAHANFLNEAATQCLPKHFAVHRRQPKPSWIQEDTWDTIATTRQLRRQLRQLHLTWAVGIMRQIFQTWASGVTNTTSFHPWLRMLDISTASALHNLSKTRLTRIKALRRDEAAYIDNCARIQHDELTEAKGAYLWRKLRRDLPSFRKKTKKHLPFSVAMEGMHSHFAQIEDARFRTMGEMCQDSQSKSQCAIKNAQERTVAEHHLPTIFELEAAIRSSSCGKASVGCVPLEFLKAHPPKAAGVADADDDYVFQIPTTTLILERRSIFSLIQREGQPARRSKFQGYFDWQCYPKAVSQDSPATADEGG